MTNTTVKTNMTKGFKKILATMALTASIVGIANVNSVDAKQATGNKIETVKVDNTKQYKEKKVYTAKKDLYGYKIIAQHGIDTVYISRVVSVDKKDKYVTIQNVLDSNDNLVVDMKYFNKSTIKIGTIVQATVDGTSENYDIVYKVKKNKDIVKSKHVMVYGQDVFYDEYYNDVK